MHNSNLLTEYVHKGQKFYNPKIVEFKAGYAWVFACCLLVLMASLSGCGRALPVQQVNAELVKARQEAETAARESRKSAENARRDLQRVKVSLKRAEELLTKINAVEANCRRAEGKLRSVGKKLSRTRRSLSSCRRKLRKQSKTKSVPNGSHNTKNDGYPAYSPSDAPVAVSPTS